MTDKNNKHLYELVLPHWKLRIGMHILYQYISLQVRFSTNCGCTHLAPAHPTGTLHTCVHAEPLALHQDKFIRQTCEHEATIPCIRIKMEQLVKRQGYNSCSPNQDPHIRTGKQHPTYGHHMARSGDKKIFIGIITRGGLGNMMHIQ